MFIFFHWHTCILLQFEQAMDNTYLPNVIKVVCRPYKLVNQTLCNFFNIFITFLFLSSLNQRKKGNFWRISTSAVMENMTSWPQYTDYGRVEKNITDQFGIVGLLNPANHGIRVATVIEFSVGLFLCLFVLLLHFY